MKCVSCGRDSNYPDRANRICPGCRKEFAFETRQGDPFTDVAFKNAIDAVSSKGKLRWGVENLYYELARKKRSKLKSAGPGCLVPVVFVAIVSVVGFATHKPGLGIVAGLVAFIALLALLYGWTHPVGLVALEPAKFDELWKRWVHVHGLPGGVIVRPPKREHKPREADLPDYSFDRAVICDRARTVDLLLANNFHFENNCAILSITGYPEGPFETVRAMLKRNPRLEVFALHDATPFGCHMAHRLAIDPAWFHGQVPVIDVGLRPAHAAPFNGLIRKSEVPHVRTGEGIDAKEAEWLSKYALELAAIRPEQTMKRLFRALARKDDRGTDTGEGGASYGVVTDSDSFSTDASASDGGSDSFG